MPWTLAGWLSKAWEKQTKQIKILLQKKKELTELKICPSLNVQYLSIIIIIMYINMGYIYIYIYI